MFFIAYTQRVYLIQESEVWTRFQSSQLPIFVKRLAHSQAPLFTYHLWLLLLQQRSWVVATEANTGKAEINIYRWSFKKPLPHSYSTFNIVEKCFCLLNAFLKMISSPKFKLPAFLQEPCGTYNHLFTGHLSYSKLLMGLFWIWLYH